MPWLLESAQYWSHATLGMPCRCLQECEIVSLGYVSLHIIINLYVYFSFSLVSLGTPRRCLQESAIPSLGFRISMLFSRLPGHALLLPQGRGILSLG